MTVTAGHWHRHGDRYHAVHHVFFAPPACPAVGCGLAPAGTRIRIGHHDDHDLNYYSPRLLLQVTVRPGSEPGPLTLSLQVRRSAPRTQVYIMIPAVVPLGPSPPGFSGGPGGALLVPARRGRPAGAGRRRRILVLGDDRHRDGDQREEILFRHAFTPRFVTAHSVALSQGRRAEPGAAASGCRATARRESRLSPSHRLLGAAGWAP